MSTNESVVHIGLRLSARLDTLPNEVLSLVTRHLDPSDSASLAQTCRRLIPLCEAGTWRELDLTAMSRFYTLQAEDESVPARRAADLYLEAAKWMIGEVMEAGNRRRWGQVDSVKLCAVAGIHHRLVHLLELVAPNVKDIHVQHAHAWVDSPKGLYNDHATLDLLLLNANISFSNLTHLRLDKGAILFPAALTLLVEASPNLVRLEADIEVTQVPAWYKRGVPPFPPPTRETKIRHLCLRYERLDYEDEDEYGNDGDVENANAAILSLLKRSPHLQQFSLRYWGGELQRFFPSLARVLEGCKHLRDLYWGHDVLQHQSLKDRKLSARVLVLDAEDEADIFTRLQVGPHLRVIHYDVTDEYNRTPPKDSSLIPPERLAALQLAQPMLYHWSRLIRHNPHLHHITQRDRDYPESGFDILDWAASCRNGRGLGQVSSWICGDREVLHVRLHLGVCTVADTAEDDMDPGDRGVHVLDYRAEGGQRRRRVYDRLPRSVIQYFTDYEGKCVPLEVIESMREAEDLRKEEWYQRGVQVGEAAWQVLTDWSGGSAQE